jgi:hypothetical protein
MRRFSLLLLPLLIVFAGCRWHLQQVALPSTSGPASWTPEYHAGEQLEFGIAWHHVALAKLLELEGEAGVVGDRRAAMIELVVDGDGLVATVMKLHDEMLSVLDLDRGVPLSNNGTFEALFRGWGGVRGRNAPLSPWTTMAEGLPVQDVASGMGLLRAWPHDRKSGHLNIALGATTFRIDLVNAGIEPIMCLGRRTAALRLEGIVRDGKRPYRFTVWITADDRRLPARVVSETTKIGLVEMDLLRWAPGH